MTDAGLEKRYQVYLAALNERRFDDLVHFVPDELTCNDQPMTRRQYRDLIADDVAAIPDLVFDVGMLVVADDEVAWELIRNVAIAPMRGPLARSSRSRPSRAARDGTGVVLPVVCCRSGKGQDSGGQRQRHFDGC